MIKIIIAMGKERSKKFKRSQMEWWKYEPACGERSFDCIAVFDSYQIKETTDLAVQEHTAGPRSVGCGGYLKSYPMASYNHLYLRNICTVNKESNVRDMKKSSWVLLQKRMQMWQKRGVRL